MIIIKSQIVVHSAAMQNAQNKFLLMRLAIYDFMSILLDSNKATSMRIFISNIYLCDATYLEVE